jgi:hypothetical protein
MVEDAASGMPGPMNSKGNKGTNSHPAKKIKASEEANEY